MLSKINIFIISLLFSTHVLSSVPKGIQDLKSKLQQHNSELLELGAMIKSLDHKISNRQQNYLKNLEDIKMISSGLDTIKPLLSVKMKELERLKHNEMKAFQLRVLSEVDNSSEDYLIEKAFLNKQLKKLAREYDRVNKEIIQMKRKTSQYQAQLSSLKQTESSLHQIIFDLENRKKDYGQTYVNKVEIINELEQKVDNTIALTHIESKGTQPLFSQRLLLPLKKFLSYKGSKKGVTFKYNESLPVYATSAGKIAFSGELAAYGKVVIIDHGNGFRSVILGDLDTRVNKDDLVIPEQVIAYTKTDNGISKSLYYEIRKRNKVQNTLSFLKTNQVL